MFEGDAVGVLVGIGAHIELEGVLELVVDLLAFKCVVVEVDAVETKSKHGWQPADALAHELSGFSLAGLALDAVEFFKIKQIFK